MNTDKIITCPKCGCNTLVEEPFIDWFRCYSFGCFAQGTISQQLEIKQLKSLCKQIKDRAQTCNIDHAALTEDSLKLTFNEGVKLGHICAASVINKVKL